MRNSNSRCQTYKKRLSKCKRIFYSYNEIQFKYGNILDLNEEIIEIIPNYRLVGCVIGDNFTSDFVCKKKNGELMVRECVERKKIIKPMMIKLLDCSRNYWLSKGVKDWGIVLDE